MTFSQKIDFQSSTSKGFSKPRSISSFYLEIYLKYKISTNLFKQIK